MDSDAKQIPKPQDLVYCQCHEYFIVVRFKVLILINRQAYRCRNIWNSKIKSLASPLDFSGDSLTHLDNTCTPKSYKRIASLS